MEKILMQESAKIIDGKKLAHSIETEIKNNILKLKENYNIQPCLAVIIVDGNIASQIYVKNKQKKAESLGIKTIVKKYPNNCQEQEIEKQILKWNEDKNIHGILLQLPLPEQLDSYKLLQTISPSKDVDGLHALNIGKLSWQKNCNLIACTPQGCLELLKTVIDDFTGLHAVVVGCSNLVGRPMAQLLLQKDCSVSIVHSKTPDISVFTKQADILIVAAGVPNLIRGHMLKKDTIVVDVGINKLANNRITGDVNFSESIKIAKAITPVPGGVGPMTIVSLMKNIIIATHIQNNIKPF